MFRIILINAFLALLISLPATAQEQSLNPEAANPHEARPKKKITEEQKKAAWEAKTKKKKQLEAETKVKNTTSVTDNGSTTGR